MIMTIIHFFLPICEAKRAENLIKEKQQCLKELDKCGEELKQKLEKEIDELLGNSDELRILLEKEFERKKTIEGKGSTLFTVISLLGVIFAFFYRIIETVTNSIFLYFLGFFILLELIYLILSVSSLLYVLVEINITYEPSSNSLEELRKTVLLNRYQNIIRTNYLNTIYSNIKLFFWLLLVAFATFFIYLVLN